jgi:hypothetical protein
MQDQNCEQHEYHPTHCGHCGARLTDMLTELVCPSCQSQLPVSRRITVFFETTGAEDCGDGVKVSVGGAVTLLCWRDFETPAQLWHRVGELVQLVWSRWPDIADLMEPEPDPDPEDEFEAEDPGESRWIGDPTDLSGLPEI